MSHLRIKPIFEWVLALGLGLFCVAPNSSGLVAVLLILLTIIAAIRKESRFQFSPALAVFVLLYVAYAIGAIWTDHPADAAAYFEKKLSFVAFPLIFSFRFKEGIRWRLIASGLIGGTILAFVLSSIHATQIYFKTADFNNSFGSSSFSYIHHPTYLAAIFTISWLWFREGKRLGWRWFNQTSFFCYTGMILAGLLFCFSLASLLFFMIVSGVLILQWFHQRVSKRLFWLSVCVLPMIPVAAYKSNIHIQIELDSIMHDARSYITNPQGIFQTIRDNPSGNQTRLLMWTVSAQEFMANPLGCGTANLDDVLTARLDSHGLQDFSAFKYNPHNQFLQVAVEIGILGLLVFLSVFVLLFRLAWKRKDGLLFWITFSLFFNCLFESMLQRQSGIVFYMILLGLFVAYRTVHASTVSDQKS